MARAEDSNEFYWDTFFVKVENKLFCVPRREFIQSSEIFADMFLSHSGLATCSEGQDRDHPIVVEGFKKDEFTCLLKVMYPTAKSLIPGGNLELNLKKEEWVSVLKLSTIWNMTKIRQYAIHWLSTNVALSPIEKILLAREHRVGAWLDEAVTSLATYWYNPLPTLEDLATLGWETVARILWIRDNLSQIAQRHQTMPRTRRDAIRCALCLFSLSSVLQRYDHCSCSAFVAFGSEFTYSGPARPTRISGSGSRPGSIDFKFLVTLGQIQCPICRENPFLTAAVTGSCNSCSSLIDSSSDVRIDAFVTLDKLIEEMFGEEIKGYERIPEYSPRSPGPGSDNPA